MRTLGNIIWLIFAGLWLALAYVIAGVVCCILIVTIPFGIASFRIAAFALWPFGQTIVDKPTAGGWSVLGNVVWFIFAGVWLALAQIGAGIAFCLTIIGIPLGLASFKMVPISLFPLGKDIVPTDSLTAAYRY